MVSASYLRNTISMACAIASRFMTGGERRDVEAALAAMPSAGLARVRDLREVLRVVSGSWLYSTDDLTDLRGRSTLADLIGLSADGAAFLRQSTVLGAAAAITARVAAGRGTIKS